MRVRVPPYPHPYVIFASGFSSDPDAKTACKQAYEKALSKFETPVSDKDIVALIFVTSRYDPQEVMGFFKGMDFVGTSTLGSITPDSESDTPGIVVNLINKREIYCETFSASVSGRKTREIGKLIAQRFETSFKSSLILLTTPFYDVSELLEGIGEESSIKVSGGVSSSDVSGPIFVFENGNIGSYMLAGIFLEGLDTDFRILQSCRILGESFFVTHAYDNVIQEIEGLEAEDFLQEVLLPQASEEAEKAPLWFIAIPTEEEIPRFIPITHIEDGRIYLAENIDKRGYAISFEANIAYLSRKFSEKSAAQELSSLPTDIDFSLFFNCVARNSIIGKKDISVAKRKNKINFEISGFLTNGEIATLRKPVLLTYTGVFALYSRQKVM